MANTSSMQQIVEKINDSNNILVTVNTNPSVDELSAALGITLCINKLNKHGTAVFSGDVPPAIEFLNPEKTFENTVDSLRDFIIALDKEKADHLRYKVDGDMVKIFITPYRTTINEDDLDFSQGDYNVEFVLAIGVKSEEDLDRALESHGRILHDATVATITRGDATNLGTIEWTDSNASSYGEMLFALADGLRSDKHIIDEQIANAFLTGIVAATDRFSNINTTSTSMTIAAQLMSAGANQQLIATKLQEEQEISKPADNKDDSKNLEEGKSTKIENAKPERKAAPKEKKSDGSVGALTISHVPEGTLDEVSKEVADKKSSEALDQANAKLGQNDDNKPAEKTDEPKANAEPHPDKPTESEAAKKAEDNLTEQLKSTLPMPTQLPTVQELQKDIANARPDGSVPAAVTPLKSRTDQEAAEPSLGGTLNATTEQAESDARRAAEDERNKTLLSHNNGTYSTDAPSFQSPLNATSASVNAEPQVKDIFTGGEPEGEPATVHAEAVQPPAPAAPTLAEIDSQNRSDAHADARAAIDAAISAGPGATATGQPGDLPPLPPLPPMPDFSTLPPLPGETPTPAANVSVPDTLGTALPPAEPVAAPAPTSNDPAQFKIPGQP